MSYHLEWAVESKGILMVMSEEVVQTFSQFVQNDIKKTEAGGIILGVRRHDHFEIVKVTTPTEFDKRSRAHWSRSDKLHSKIAEEMWRESKGEITYLGEWHTHPEIKPSPSFVDIEEWKKLCGKCHIRAGYIMVIVGISDLWCGVAQKNTLLPMIKIN